MVRRRAKGNGGGAYIRWQCQKNDVKNDASEANNAIQHVGSDPKIALHIRPSWQFRLDQLSTSRDSVGPSRSKGDEQRRTRGESGEAPYPLKRANAQNHLKQETRVDCALHDEQTQRVRLCTQFPDQQEQARKEQDNVGNETALRRAKPDGDHVYVFHAVLFWDVHVTAIADQVGHGNGSSESGLVTSDGGL